jgi:hypothetical protein
MHVCATLLIALVLLLITRQRLSIHGITSCIIGHAVLRITGAMLVVGDRVACNMFGLIFSKHCHTLPWGNGVLVLLKKYKMLCDLSTCAHLSHRVKT